MSYRHLVPAALTACAFAATFAAFAAAPTTGIDRPADPQVKPQADFFRHVNGRWLKATAIPADRASTSGFEEIHERIQPQLRGLIEAAAASGKPATDVASKIGTLYGSFMDEASIEKLGAAPLAAQLAAIDAITDKRGLTLVMAGLMRANINTPLAMEVEQDSKDSTRYTVSLSQAGLALPDRDYYLVDTDAKFKLAREAYLRYLTQLFALVGERGGEAAARDVLALETDIARIQWTRVENRDPVKRYNRVELADLDKLAPGYAWMPLLQGLGLDGKVTYVVVSQPSFVTGFAALQERASLATWKAYLKARVTHAYAPYLSRAFVDARFAFAGTALTGTPKNLPRWKRGVNLVQATMAEGLGQVYVDKYFPPASKTHMERLVANLLEAYRQSIDTLEWMSPETRKEAQAKLATFSPKIGYPKRWIDYGALEVQAGDPVGNVRRAAEFETQRQLAKLGGPVDRDEWFMGPQVVNAYYNPGMNEIVFPAAILQPPFFDPKADDAVNYGAIGAVIGHEISHGFDDQGSQYDGVGNLRDWWTKDDRARFDAKAKMLVAQYDAFSPLPGYHVNGALTLGENIADNSGLAIAFKAYRLSLGGKPAPVIGGMTGDERFFRGFAQVWRSKTRDSAMLSRIKADPHSPEEFRANGTVRNHPDFHRVFRTKPGDAMYLAPADRVLMW